KGNDATRERFLADAPHYSIIHLATHAKANDEEGEYSYLAFTEIPDSLQNELLYAKDLYSLRLQAEMVVLSACESGVGELRRGEGVISLARGFSYAGAKSLVTTLWRVSDRESAVLMQLFYRQLKEGKPKDEALRVAKLQFIDQNNGARAHPFFWGAFILSGDMAPIAVDQPTFTLLGFALLGVLFVFLSAHF
ncbi:MAG: CHAT domain-containing protein, partial [Phaeodactylibacter sp.]|nr:CHAT domain-containing protein [Phaeodactylibacter sp.]